MIERERLTTKREKIYARECVTLNAMNKDVLRQHYNEIFDRLQEYEVEAENGLLLKMPCKVGDMVFVLWKIRSEKTYIKYGCEVKEICLSKRNCRDVKTYKLEPVSFRGRILEYGEEDFGEWVFLTKEEAEAALKGMGGVG